MNKEILNEQLTATELRNPGMRLLVPGDLTSDETADNVIKLLKAMYVEHGITKDKVKLVNDINAGNVLSWFAKKDEDFVATASLVKQPDGAWELGRAVSMDRGNGIGKRVILEALMFHLKNHTTPLTAEVRAAAEFRGIPSGEATQKIFFDTINKILPITPFAVAPLFAHGEPLRNESFILSASDVKPGKTISERIADVINNRSTKGIISRLRVDRTVPFQTIVPDEQGIKASDILEEVNGFDGSTLFPIETTDKNMPLIGMLSANEDMVVCGVDRVLGNEGKPILLIASIGFGWHSAKDGRFGDHTLLAPSVIGDSLPISLRKDIASISEKFTRKNQSERAKFRAGEAAFWESEFEALHQEDRKAQIESELAKETDEERRKREESWDR